MIDKAFFLFPGQGAQYPGMALDFLEQQQSSAGKKVKDLFSLASEFYGKNMAVLLKEADAETLKRTDVSQPAITLANLAAAAYMEQKFLELKLPAEGGIKPAGCAGFSLGEYAALAIAGVICEEDCFLLVIQRGKVMQAAIDRIEADGTSSPGMAAVVGLAPEKAEALISEWKTSGNTRLKDLYAANINSPRQTAVSGTAEALSEAESLFLNAGARRYIRLQVNCPFHSPLLAGAAEEFRPVLEKVVFKDPKIPFYSNVSGKRVVSGEEAKKLALQQITSPVRWTSEETAISAAGGIECLLELGPGKVLQGLWKENGSPLPCYAAGTTADINNLFTKTGANQCS